MPNTLNAQAGREVQSQTERRHHRGQQRQNIDPRQVRCLNHWPRSTLPHISDTSRSLLSRRVSMERWDRCRPTQEIRWREEKKGGEVWESRRVFSGPGETPDHPVETSGQGERDTQRHTEGESYATPVLRKDKFYHLLLCRCSLRDESLLK